MAARLFALAVAMTLAFVALGMPLHVIAAVYILATLITWSVVWAVTGSVWPSDL
jgi:hypothetical protein